MLQPQITLTQGGVGHCKGSEKEQPLPAGDHGGPGEGGGTHVKKKWTLDIRKWTSARQVEHLQCIQEGQMGTQQHRVGLSKVTGSRKRVWSGEWLRTDQRALKCHTKES